MLEEIETGMEVMSAETVTILLGFLALAGGQAATLLTLILRMDRERKETNQRFDELNKRFDAVSRDVGELRERMAKLEGALEGFLAGQRDRNAA